MRQLPALDDPARSPRPVEPDAAAVGLERIDGALNALDSPTLAQVVQEISNDLAFRQLLSAIAGNSPFLTQCLTRDIGTALSWYKDGPDAVLRDILTATEAASGAASEADLIRDLRVAKRRMAISVALSDIAGLWSVEQTTGALSEFADASSEAALGFLIRRAVEKGQLPEPNDPDRPTEGCGFFMLGMGKLGGGELNYSSDIDLIALYDTGRVPEDYRDTLHKTFVRMTRDLVRVLEQRTADGYVFRTDLRLRPDPGATPLAISTLAAETYYESLGQNWERAAMIKARPIAGDLEAGQAFLKFLQPFVWRKHLDFAAIQDIHSIKRQIHAHKGGGTIAIRAHNIKLGRGGIREIEFFAQTQQLIWGGRTPELRATTTRGALTALADAGRISSETAADMIEAYGFLRTLEHRLQMVDDQQTHSMPDTPEGMARIAAFMGFEDEAALSAALETQLRRVEAHYADLFEEADDLGGPGNLVFTGGEHDPDTLETLSKLGFSEPERISTVVRGWHHGRYRATRSTRAREILTEIMPSLLDALAKTPSPDEAFVKFDEFLAAQPAGIPLFSLLYANPGTLELIAEIMGSAPRLADHLAGNASLFEAVLARGFYQALPDGGALRDSLSEALAQARDFEDVLDISRRWTNDHRFQVGIQLFRGMIDAEDAGASLADIADTVLGALLAKVVEVFAQKHGSFDGGGVVILALGKLGSREMTFQSDLDLILLYEVPEGAEQSDGERPLAPSHYHIRLIQRFINAATAPTSEGPLYEIDMRLRPSGNAGPLATSLAGFVQYQEGQAWTWEQMALSRARVVCGAPSLAAKVETAITDLLARRRDRDALLVAVAEMRERIDKEHGTQSLWQVKHRRGGLVDLEFVTQYLQLAHAADHPEILSSNTIDAIHNLAAAGLVDQAAAATLVEAAQFWHALQGMLRLTVGENFDEEQSTRGLRSLLARAAGATDFDDLKDRIVRISGEVMDLYEKIIAEPAQAAGKADTGA